MDRVIREGERNARASQADVGTYQDAEKLVREALKCFGRIDNLVNHAGIVSRNPIQDVRRTSGNA